MPNRVTNLRTTDVLIQQIFDRRSSLEKVRQQISSGIDINIASDDPGKAGTILNLQSLISRIDRHKDRISYAQGLLDHQESTLDSADSIMVRAQELATQGANESLSPENRQLLANEVFQLRDQMVALANTTFQGRYVYGGAEDGTAPFTQGTYTVPAVATDPAAMRWIFNSDASTGATQTRTIQVSDDPNSTVRVNSTGDEVWVGSISALERLGRALQGYRTTVDVNGVPTGAGTAYTQPADYKEQTHDIDAALDAINFARTNDIVVERSNVGARLARLENVTGMLDSLKSSSESTRSDLQDADIFEASSNFANLQTTLQALLASSAQINNLSLLNYI